MKYLARTASGYVANGPHVTYVDKEQAHRFDTAEEAKQSVTDEVTIEEVEE